MGPSCVDGPLNGPTGYQQLASPSDDYDGPPAGTIVPACTSVVDLLSRVHFPPACLDSISLERRAADYVLFLRARNGGASYFCSHAVCVFCSTVHLTRLSGALSIAGQPCSVYYGSDYGLQAAFLKRTMTTTLSRLRCVTIVFAGLKLCLTDSLVEELNTQVKVPLSELEELVIITGDSSYPDDFGGTLTFVFFI